MADVRSYTVHARSTEVFGRVEVAARDTTLVVDGPVENGCPGEEITPGEMFLGAVAACGVELIQVLARSQDVPLASVAARVEGTIDRGAPLRADVSVFNRVRLHLELAGVGNEDAAGLVEAFKGR